MSATSVDVKGRRITVHLTSGRAIELPVERFPRLSEATDEQLMTVTLRRAGEALRWEVLDEDIQVAAVIAQRWPTHGGFRIGSGRKPGANKPTTARVNKHLLKKVDKESRRYAFSKADIFNDALILRYFVMPYGGSHVQGKYAEVDFSSLASFGPLKDLGYTGLQFRLLKRKPNIAAKVHA